MTYISHLSGVQGASLGQVLVNELAPVNVKALGIASAFVSVGGVRDLLTITRRRPALECRLIAGISNSITHPQALMDALDAGWNVRFGTSRGRTIFHPKMILSGRSFLGDGCIRDLSFAYVGSSNLTKGGLHNNIECGVIARADFAPSLTSCFASLWDAGRRATAQSVQAYASEFARQNRERRVVDLEALGVGDGVEAESVAYEDLPRQRANARREVVPQSTATAAWPALNPTPASTDFRSNSRRRQVKF